MSKAENTSQQPRHSPNRKGSMKPITRRGIIAAGGGILGRSKSRPDDCTPLLERLLLIISEVAKPLRSMRLTDTASLSC